MDGDKKSCNDKEKIIDSYLPSYFGPSSLLGRILCLQRLDYLGIDTAFQYYEQLHKRLGNRDAVDTKLQEVLALEKNMALFKCKLDEEIINVFGYDSSNNEYYFKTDIFADPLKRKGLNMNKNFLSSHTKRMKVEESEKQNVSPNQTETENYIKSTKKDILEKCEKMSNEEIIKDLQHYLIAMTIKDASLMILLNGPYER